MSLLSRVRLGRRFVVGMSCALVMALFVPSLSAADKPAVADKTDSLDWVPQDAAFYSSSRRMGEQLKILLASNAAKKIQEMPVLKMALAQAQQQLEDPTQPAGMVKAFFDLPENEQLLHVIGDMFSNEAVIYGDNDWVGAFKLLRELNQVTNQMQVEQIKMMQELDLDEDEDFGEKIRKRQAITARGYLDLIKRNLDQCKMPTMVMGFRMKDNVPAETQLKRLEVIAKVAFARVPQLKEAISRKKIDGVDYLSFSFEAKHLPWDELPLESFEREKGEYKKVFEHLKTLKVVVNLGVWNNWLIVSIASSDEPLAKLGQGKTLRGRKEFAKMADYKDARLTSVVYASEEFMFEVNNWRRQIDDLVEMANRFLPLAPLPEPIKDRIAADIEEMGGDIKSELPEPGAVLSFSYLTKQGYDFRRFDWSTGSLYDSSQPLSILKHVGGSPILAIATRGKYKPKQYDTLRKWVKKGHKYFEDLALPQFSERERKQYEKVAEQAYPLIRRLDQTTEKKLIPALADGQSALVLDARMASEQWMSEMPKAASPLPLPEPALLVGVSDAKLLQQAFADYRVIANDAVKAAREISPEEVPPFELPPLSEKSLKSGSMFYFPIPKELYQQAANLDQRLLPNLGLSKTVGTFTLNEAHTERLLAATPLATTGPLAKADRKAAMAVYFNWAALVNAAKPWVNYGFAVAAMEGEFGRLPDADRGSRKDVSTVKLPAEAAMILSQVHIGLEVAQCLRSYEGVTYKDGDVWVSEGQLQVVDLKP